MAEWYYTALGACVGPKTEEEMRRLIEVGKVPPTALCWTAEFGLNWKSVSETNLAQPVGPESGPPALPPRAVNNLYAWLFAAVPLIGAIIDIVVVQNSRDPNRVHPMLFVWVYLIAYAVFAGLDTDAIRRSGNRAPPRLLWFILAPAYLWFRATRLGQNKSYFWAWIACVIVAGVIDRTLVVTAGLILS